MRRPLIALLAAVDAGVAALASLLAVFAPLTIAWAISGRWFSLWPVTSTLWSFGFGAPLDVEVPAEQLAQLGIAPDAAAWAVTLAPFVLSLAVLWFAYGSGSRAARAGAAWLGSLTGIAVFAALAAAIVLPVGGEVLSVPRAWGVAVPVAVYALGVLAGAAVEQWRRGRMFGREFAPKTRTIVSASVVGVAAASAGLVAVGAIAVTVRFVLGGAQAAAIYQGLQVDASGATALTFGQSLYLPTAVVWAVSWLAGPGFAVGTDALASPVVTTPSVQPPIPLFALVPQHSSVWWLFIVLVPIGVGALVGWIVRSRLVFLRFESETAQTRLGIGDRLIVLGAIIVLTAATWALLAVASSGGIGPGSLTHLGPNPLWLAGALAAEIGVGAAIVLLLPLDREDEAEVIEADAAAEPQLLLTATESAEVAPVDDSGDSDEAGGDTSEPEPELLDGPELLDEPEPVDEPEPAGLDEFATELIDDEVIDSVVESVEADGVEADGLEEPDVAEAEVSDSTPSDDN